MYFLALVKNPRSKARLKSDNPLFKNLVNRHSTISKKNFNDRSLYSPWSRIKCRIPAIPESPKSYSDLDTLPGLVCYNSSPNSTRRYCWPHLEFTYPACLASSLDIKVKISATTGFVFCKEEARKYFRRQTPIKMY